MGMRRIHHIDVSETLRNLDILRQTKFRLHDDQHLHRDLYFFDHARELFNALGKAKVDIEGIRLLRNDRGSNTDNSDLCAVALQHLISR